MYTREKLCRDQNHKSRKSDRNPPSFSSTLLDEIYRSIDGNVDKSEGFDGYKDKSSRRQGGGGSGGGGGYEEISSYRRTCLVEKWIEKEANDKAIAKKRQQFLQDVDNNKPLHDSDLIFFSSTSSSSDSSGALSSSDTEFFASTRGSRQKVSCFTARPKPVRTGAGASKHDDHVEDNDLIKSKSRALKIYANLKKVKQPISPGGRLTSFINSLFSNANGKKSRNPDASRGFRDVKSSAAGPSACSSASSFSRSCLSKYSPRSREKMRSGTQRTVRFEPVSVIVDEDLRPCGEKSIYESNSGRFTNLPRPQPLPESVLTELKSNKKTERVMPDSAVKGYSKKMKDVYFNENEDEDEDDEDCLSDSSSDLFELDHLSFFGSNRYSEELPVYETTHFDTNCAIASGLIR